MNQNSFNKEAVIGQIIIIPLFMKKIKYFGLLAVLAVSLNACVVHRAGWVRGHYAVGPRGGRVWVPGHYN